MVWKLPTRIHEHKRAVQPPPDIWRYLTERFYEDYWDNYNSELELLFFTALSMLAKNDSW